MNDNKKPAQAWAIQCYSGEIDERTTSASEEEAWEKFLANSTCDKSVFVADGWKAIEVIEP